MTELEKRLEDFEAAVTSARDAWHAQRGRVLPSTPPDYSKVAAARKAVLETVATGRETARLHDLCSACRDDADAGAKHCPSCGTVL